MAETTKTQDLPEFLTMAINREISRVVDEEFEKTKKRIEEKKSEIIAGVCLHVSREISMETFKESLVVTIKNQ